MNVQKIDTFAGHRDCVYALAPGPAPGQFFSSGADGLVVSWQLQRPDLGQLLARVPASVYALAYDPDRNHLWIGQNFDGVHLVDPVTKAEVHSVRITNSAIFDIKFLNNLALVALSDGVLVVMDTAGLPDEAPVVRKHLKASESNARAIAVHPEQPVFAVGYSDAIIRIFDAETLTLRQVLTGHTNSVFTVQYSPDGRFLLSGGRDAHLKVWDVAAGYVPIHDIPAHLYAINHLAYSPDGTLFATGSMDKAVKIWDAATFRLLKVIDRARHAGHGTSVNRLWWSDFRNQLVSCSDDRLISVWEVGR
ncbi:WD40 repeat domain-containing protein [Tellurirhabdus rosea]|uniref:WD40 repeat domain-containing protein n=1 Tax=Tellurirhabdus rosea TaxID=2674997 RepID=UPI00224E965C|nr:WD40 repeat domain-containing protein [Tellurirhabdus rosea]